VLLFAQSIKKEKKQVFLKVPVDIGLLLSRPVLLSHLQLSLLRKGPF